MSHSTPLWGGQRRLVILSVVQSSTIVDCKFAWVPKSFFVYCPRNFASISVGELFNVLFSLEYIGKSCFPLSLACFDHMCRKSPSKECECAGERRDKN